MLYEACSLWLATAVRVGVAVLGREGVTVGRDVGVRVGVAVTGTLVRAGVGEAAEVGNGVGVAVGVCGIAAVSTSVGV